MLEGMRALAAILVGVAVHGAAWGSGSVTLDLAGERCRLTIQQTFRKILDGDDRSYVDGVQREFAHRAAVLLPAVERALGKGTTFDVAAPVVGCEALPCPAIADTRFPATVILPPLTLDQGHELVVGTTFAKAPTARELSALHARLAAAVKPVADGRAETPLVSVPLPVIEKHGTSYTLRVHSGLWVTGGSRARHQASLEAVTAAHEAALVRLQTTPPAGLALVPCTAKLPYWEDNGRKLPGRLSRVAHGDLSSTVAILCVGRMDGKETVDRVLEAVLAR
jgi:hypothetical protein